MNGAGDDELMGRVQEGDDEAFAELYDRHATRAYRVARAVCDDSRRAEDAVQEGFLSIWRARARYRPERGSVQAWVMTTAHNRALDIVRSEAAIKRPQRVELNGNESGPSTGSPEDSVVESASRELLIGALGNLPEPQAEVIKLAFFGGLTHSEIAARLELPPGTVKGRIRLGLEKLRGHAGEPGPNPLGQSNHEGLIQD